MSLITIEEALRGISGYPVPPSTLLAVAARRGLDLDAQADGSVLRGTAFNLAKADILMWLSTAPDISQGGQSYSFTDGQRSAMRGEAGDLLSEFDTSGSKPGYGYKGSRF